MEPSRLVSSCFLCYSFLVQNQSNTIEKYEWKYYFRKSRVEGRLLISFHFTILLSGNELASTFFLCFSFQHHHHMILIYSSYFDHHMIWWSSHCHMMIAMCCSLFSLPQHVKPFQRHFKSSHDPIVRNFLTKVYENFQWQTFSYPLPSTPPFITSHLATKCEKLPRSKARV